MRPLYAFARLAARPRASHFAKESPARAEKRAGKAPDEPVGCANFRVAPENPACFERDRLLNPVWAAGPSTLAGEM
jgi:hypothetical protein